MKKYALLPLFLTGCSLIHVTPADPPLPGAPEIHLPGDVVLTPTPPVDMVALGRPSPFFSASFRLEAAGRVVYVDPLGLVDPKPADYVLLTHAHLDHLSPEDLRRVVGPSTVIVAPEGAKEPLAGWDVRVVHPGDRLELPDLGVEAVPAYNLAPVFLWIRAHPKRLGNVGYVITLGGQRIYHSGDTAWVPELDALSDLDVALVVAGGLPQDTMNAAEAAGLVNKLQPDLALPMHYETGQGIAEAFARQVNAQIRVEIPYP